MLSYYGNAMYNRMQVSMLRDTIIFELWFAIRCHTSR